MSLSLSISVEAFDGLKRKIENTEFKKFIFVLYGMALGESSEQDNFQNCSV